ncbi:MAG TPA: acetyl-CoA carboxylase biotin carboxylase subunit [Thermodesulfobacteriota bacterium]|nr:acetyl-CoA carboxylase biotin carboxylase subunit [Thermodesulfobacteriota bacterium]
MFKKVLIANRGEIAVRILRACHEMGISVVAVYSEPDRGALHVRYADEAYFLGSGPSEETYLAKNKILNVARRAKVDAIHPGYGFLAENREFAQDCEEEGIIFIGPSGESLENMGRKIRAKSNMTQAWIPVIPGREIPLDDGKAALEAANALGYPLLIKAIAGGGGKGIRRVDRAEQLFQAMNVARTEAMAAFGNEGLYLEKYIDQSRHIEFQILADHFGNIIHLFDRECSIQRRYQKILEECPSPFLDDTTRLRMAGAALSAAIATKYNGAGTVEFLVDRNKNFYYLELNARLQVEHPVTEMVTGVDIVKTQIRIAQGEKLPLTQRDVQPIGASLVCRIYAEDPENNFLPSTGRIERLQIPGGPGVRVDLGIYEGYVVPIFYDPIIAKVIVWGGNRQEAILRMDRALQELVIKGIKTTIPFHRWLVNNQRFIQGDFDTEFLDREYFQKRRERSDSFQEIACLAAVIRACQKDQKGIEQGYRIKAEDAIYPVQVEPLEHQVYRVSFNDRDRHVNVLEISENLYSMICDGQSYEVDIMEEGDALYEIFVKGKSYLLEIFRSDESPYLAAEKEELVSPFGEEIVTAPLTCQVIKILVEAGEKVEADQALLVVEAMKMEMPIPSPFPGKVKEVLVREGQTVDSGTVLLTLFSI